MTPLQTRNIHIFRGCGKSIYNYTTGYYSRTHIAGSLNNDPKITAKFMKLIKENDVKSIRKILKKVVNVNEVFRFDGELEKMTALHYVAKEGMVQMMKELLTCECDVNHLTAFDMASPLHFACQLPDNDVALTIAEDLINVGADVNIKDHAQKTPLIMASETGNLMLVRLLLDSGAEMDHKYHEEEFPSCVYHALKFVTFSPPQAEEKVDAYKGNNALIQACRAHQMPVVKELLNNGANMNVSNCNGNTPLHIACQSECRNVYSDTIVRTPVAGHSPIVKLLIEKGANLNARNNFTDTPLKRTFDGIVSLSSWNYPIEDRIDETCKMFDIIQILLHSGCDVRGLYEEVDYTSPLTTTEAESPTVVLKTALSYLLGAGKAIVSYDSARLLHQWRVCIRLLLAAGCSIQPEDIIKAEELHVTPDMLASIRSACWQPLTLKKLCNVAIRNTIHKPLKVSVAQLGLPVMLKKLVSLEITD